MGGEDVPCDVSLKYIHYNKDWDYIPPELLQTHRRIIEVHPLQ